MLNSYAPGVQRRPQARSGGVIRRAVWGAQEYSEEYFAREY
jgi:hypothetical protein